MKKILALILTMLCIASLLGGCGGKSISPDQIKEDIMTEDSVYHDYGMTITDYSETRYEGKQQEDKEVVLATVTSENDIFEFQCRYKLYYALLSDGWKLQMCSDEILGVTPKAEPDLKQVRQDVQDYYQDTLAEYQLTDLNFGDVEVVDGDGSINAFIPCRVYSVPFTGSNDRVQVDGDLVIGYQLDHRKGWVISGGKTGFRGAETVIRYTPVAGPEDAIARLMAEEGMESYEILSEEDASWKDSQKREYRIRGTDTDVARYATMIYDFEVQCLFDEQEGWIAEVHFGGKKLTDAVPHAEGTWLYDDGTGLNRYEIYVAHMDLDTISLSYDITMTDYEGAETRRLRSDGIVTMDVNANSIDDYSLKISMAENIAGPEGKGAGAYRLRFFAYVEGHEDYAESGFLLNSRVLEKIS